MENQYVPLEEYFDPRTPLEERALALADIDQFPVPESEGVNQAVMCFVVKYLLEYLMIITTDVHVIRRGVRKLVQDLTQKDGPSAMPGRRRNTVTDVFAVQCLADVHGTAALVKEIAMQRRYGYEGNQYAAVDFGTGSGVLLAAAMIDGIRTKAHSVLGVGFELQKKAAQNAERVLKKIPQTKKFMIQEDVTDPNVVGHYLAPPFEIDYCVSETISNCTPSMIVERDRIKYKEHPGLGMMLNQHHDPFAQVLSNVMRIPRFFDRVRNGSAQMFPNIIRGDYQPEGDPSRIRLHSAPSGEDFIALQEVGDEFLQFEGFHCNRRWH